MNAKLVDQEGREHNIAPEGTTIGRHKDNDLVLIGRAVSRFHAEIVMGENGWLLEDHGSTYGTFVNGKKVEGIVEIKDGDKIRLAVTRSAMEGEFNFTFHEERNGFGAVLKRAARAIVSRRKVDLGKMVFELSERMLLVRMNGIFRRREVDALKKGILDQLGRQREKRRLVLDLTDVQYMNSYGLACLVEIASSLKEKGGRIQAFGARGTILKLLKLVGSESPIELKRNEDSVLRPGSTGI